MSTMNSPEKSIPLLGLTEDGGRTAAATKQQHYNPAALEVAEFQNEQTLIQEARQYSDNERKKSLKWFVSHGDPIPTKGEVAQVAAERSGLASLRAAVHRDVDRRRAATAYGRFASVPVEEHPGFAAKQQQNRPLTAETAATTETSAQPQPSQQQQHETPAFIVTAAAGIEARRRLHEQFSALCWTVLTRQRVEQRLSMLAQRRAEANNGGGTTASAAGKDKGNTHKPTDGATRKASPAQNRNASFPALGRGMAFLEMQSLLPDTGSEAMIAMGGGGGGGGNAAKKSHNRGASDSGAPAAVAEGSNADKGGKDNKSASSIAAESLSPSSSSAHQVYHPEAPSSAAAVHVLKPKELRQPFEFKLKDYKLHKLTDHPFATCDPPEAVPHLPAGPKEVPERASSASFDGATVGVPGPLEHFTQPLVTLETYPMLDFPFLRTLPRQGLALGTRPMPVNNGGFVDPYLEQLGQNATTVGASGPAATTMSSVPPPGNPCYGIAVDEIFRRPLPKPLKRPDPADQLSDSDDENSDVAVLYPQDLREVASRLPPFHSVGSAAMATASAAANAAAEPSSPQAAAQQQQPKRAVSPQPKPKRGGGDDDASSAAAAHSSAASLAPTTVTVVPPDHLLDFTPLPIHGMADERMNRLAAERREQCAQWRSAVGKMLTLTHQLQF